MNQKNMPFNFKALIFGKASNLSNITRFSVDMRLHDESVDAHCYWVGMFAILIAIHLPTTTADAPEIDWKKLMGKCLLHDIEENVSGDYPRPFKHSTPELLHALEKAARRAATAVCDELSPTLSKVLYNWWYTAKDESVEGCIVALADLLSVLRWGLLEIAMGNIRMRNKLEPLRAYMSEFEASKYDFMRTFVDAAYELTMEILND